MKTFFTFVTAIFFTLCTYIAVRVWYITQHEDAEVYVHERPISHSTSSFEGL